MSKTLQQALRLTPFAQDIRLADLLELSEPSADNADNRWPAMSERSESNGGGGDRTRVSSDVTALISNDLRQRVKRLAALWLQLSVSNEHDLARIVAIAEAWPSLPEFLKARIESLCRLEHECDIN